MKKYVTRYFFQVFIDADEIKMFEDIRLLSTYFCRVPVQTSEHKIAVLAGAVSGCLNAVADDRHEIIPKKTRHVIQAVLTRRGKYFMFFVVNAKTFDAHEFFEFNLFGLEKRDVVLTHQNFNHP